MFKNYFRAAWRNITANKFYSIINISGLAIGLATGIMLLLWVQNEFSYDKFIKDYQHIYEFSATMPTGNKTATWPGVPGPLAVYARSIPQVKSIVRINNNYGQLFSNADHSKILRGFNTAFVDSNFFSMFNYTLLEGNKKDLFPNINTVVLTQSTAKKIFGGENAMGKVIITDGNNFTVTGILQDFPQNSSMQYDALFPMAFYAKQFTANGGNGSWKTIDEDLGDYYYTTFIKLLPGANPITIAKAFTAAYKKARNGDIGGSYFNLENLADVHLISADGNNSGLRMVQIFMLVAILLLLIAAINYVNLSTARSMIRAKEVSVRKIVGADKKQLFLQFIIETFVLFCIAIIIAIGLIVLLMPLYNQISGKDLHFSLANAQVWEVILISVIGTLLASGLYPALLLTSFDPIYALKGKVSSGIGVGFFRKILVVFQFAISVILIISTLVIGYQMRFVRQKSLGYNKSYVFTVQLPNEALNHINAIKNDLDAQPGILSVANSDIDDITNIENFTGDLDWQGKPANSGLLITRACVGKNFIPTMKIQFIEGGNFSGTPADSCHYILNETAVQKMGLKPPYIGQPITFHDQKGTIIGVVKDFNFKSLKDPVTPFIFFTDWYQGNILYIRTTAKDAQQAISSVRNEYKKYAGDIPFSYNFIDKQFAANYKSDQQAGVLFNLFAAIAIFISCLGLFGLATFTAQRRTKEIGVRKVLGASVINIIKMISMDFLKLVIIAIIIAIPVGWFFMNKWLQNFAYKTNISWWIFGLAAVIAILIAVGTVSWQAIRAAVANSVESLRTE
jgi:ABC-type antimicrobial peptide transport system permease subunit